MENNLFKNNFFKRSISILFLMPTFIYILLAGSTFRLYLFFIIFILMHIEWYKINNNNSKPILYWSGCIYITCPLIFWALFRYNKVWPYSLSFFIIVWSCDIFAYIGGKLIGGKKFVPSISPNKTWSGVACGIIFAEITGQCCYYYFGRSMFNILPDNLWERTLFILIIAIGTILGDLLESKIKRKLQIKDSGNLIPGHGGILDRFDGFLGATWLLICNFTLRSILYK